ncbi:MAG TPA: hypothetical protein VF475_16530 [Sphingobium sp.]
MRKFDDQARKTVLETVRGSLLMLAFGLAMLAYLVAIDRTQWFNLRPASGTAAAMSKASDTRTSRQKIDAAEKPGAIAGIHAGETRGSN